jgi:hypothetical protein
MTYASCNVHWQVRDMEWLNASAVVAAVGSTLALVQVNTSHPDFLCEVVQLPQFHTDCIRELAINPANTVRSLRVCPNFKFEPKNKF